MKLSEQKRLHILEAAEQLFYEQGVEHTSMDQIARLANVSKRTVYNHFDTKEDLFHAIVARMLEQLDETAAISFDESKGVDEQLTQIAAQEVALLKSKSFLRIAKIAFLQMLHKPELAKSLGNNKIGCMLYLERFLSQAVQANKLQIEDVELAAKQFVYQLKSFVFYPRLYRFEEPNEQQEAKIIKETVTMFLARYALT